MFLCGVINTLATKVTHLESVDSTQHELLRRIRNGSAVHGEVVITDYQTSGVGAGGTHWVSGPQQNALLSIALKFHSNSASSPLMSMCLALSILEVVRVYQPNALIKWPNDVLINQKKVAGILVNNTYSGSSIQWTVWGVGINVGQTDFPEMPVQPTSLAMEGVNTSKETIIEQILSQLSNAWWLITMSKSGQIIEQYNRNIFGINEVRTFHLPTGQIEGKVIGVNENGALVLKTESGIKEFYHKEIEWMI